MWRGAGGEVFAATWDTASEQLAALIWEGKAKPENLNRDFVLKYYAGLNKSAQQGWGGGYYADNGLTRKFRENLLKFSGAKSYNLVRSLMDEKEGLSREAFMEKAKSSVSKHNETWQQTEEKFAANSASAARNFNDFQKDADLYPNLKYCTMQDSEVRPEHAANEGVIWQILSKQ